MFGRFLLMLALTVQSSFNNTFKSLCNAGVFEHYSNTLRLSSNFEFNIDSIKALTLLSKLDCSE